jgi:hypothetical protein
MKCLKCKTGGRVVNKADTYGVKRTCQGCGHSWNSYQDREEVPGQVLEDAVCELLDGLSSEEPEFIGIRPYTPEAPVSPPEEVEDAPTPKIGPAVKRGAKRKPRVKKGM